MQGINMLVIKPRAQGGGIFDVIVKAANSALAKKVITSAVNKAANSNIAKKVINSGVAKKVLDSSVGKTISENITKENFKKAANSALGKQLTKTVADKVDNAFEKAAISGLQKLGLTTPTVPSQIESPVLPSGRTFTAKSSVLPPGKKRKATYGRKKGKKRRKIGKGIILQ